jgi:hypothetical protein
MRGLNDLLNFIQARAAQTNGSFEAELETYLLHYSPNVMPEVRARLDIIHATQLANSDE